jgi:hypothetical protein
MRQTPTAATLALSGRNLWVTGPRAPRLRAPTCFIAAGTGTLALRWRFRRMRPYRDPLVLLLVATAAAAAFFAVLVSM